VGGPSSVSVDNLSIDAASYSSRTTTSTSGACGANDSPVCGWSRPRVMLDSSLTSCGANDSPNTSAGGGGGGVHGPGAIENNSRLRPSSTVLRFVVNLFYGIAVQQIHSKSNQVEFGPYSIIVKVGNISDLIIHVKSLNNLTCRNDNYNKLRKFVKLRTTFITSLLVAATSRGEEKSFQGGNSGS